MQKVLHVRYFFNFQHEHYVHTYKKYKNKLSMIISDEAMLQNINICTLNYLNKYQSDSSLFGKRQI